MEHVIWEDVYFWDKTDVVNYYKDYCEATGEEFDESKAYQFCLNDNEYNLDTEKDNLDIDTEEEIIAIADLGLWDGRRVGYRLLNYVLSNIFKVGEDYNRYYADRYNVKADCVHHDGTNYITFRMFKSGLTEEQKDNFTDKLYYGTVKPQDISRYTVSILPLVKKIYGWK